MASMQPEKSLQEETTCSICLEYFKYPVTTDCGHNFCRVCITEYWEGVGRKGICPQCRARSAQKALQVNTQLANIVENVKQLAAAAASPRKPQDGQLCGEHGEKLCLFCKEDEKPICVVCDRSVQHRKHAVVPLEEAAEEYKTSVNRLLNPLRRRLQDQSSWISKNRQRIEELKSKFKAQRENIVREFDESQQYLEARKQGLLTDLEEEEKELLKSMCSKISHLEEEQSSLQALIADVDNKSDLEFLKDAKDTLSRCEQIKVEQLETDSPEETKNLKSFLTRHSSLKQAMLEFKERLSGDLDWRRVRSYASEISLDQDTANPWLIVSEDGKSVVYGDEAQNLPKTPGRYDSYAIVLGRERLMSGRHYWEVEVGRKTSWTLGVCDESRSRKGGITLDPTRGYWVLRLIEDKYYINTSKSIPVNSQVRPSVVGIFLDIEAGTISFYNMEGRSILYTFLQVSFPRTLRPCFSPSIKDGGRNSGPLQIVPVKIDE
ncbi:E3 ubiquitin-protein ligase TRIM39-like [Ambystoma mexicanum]|uniref:E3 ubiquitin-protein ligase TRIM39-like n=1 Tax=Ambystoma mexicanum TaxID=8296 RepID=UPI0037E71574